MKRLILSILVSVCFTATSNGQIISQYVETNAGSTPKGIEILNNTTSTLDFATTNLIIAKGTNGGVPSTDYTVTSGTLSPGAVIVIGTSDIGTYLTNSGLTASFYDKSFVFNGNDALVVIFGTDTTDIFGVPGNDPGSRWSGNGVSTEGQNIQISPSINTGIITQASVWSEPSTRFEVASNNPSGVEGLVGFGVAPLERLITGDAGWRLLSFPISGGTAADVSDDSPVQGITGGDDASADSSLTVYGADGVWRRPASVSTAIGDGYGFAMYFFDNTTNGSSELPVVLDASGSEPANDVAVSLNGGAPNQFTLVGNPFASNYNTNSITSSGGNISDNVSFWNDTINSYTTGDRTTGFTVAPWQGFWVETSDASVTGITFPTSGKTTSSTTGTFFSKQAGFKGDLAFTLSSGNSYDEAIRIAIRDYAEIGYDRADAGKLIPLSNRYATMAFRSNELLKAVESLPSNLNETLTLELDLNTVGVSGEFTFKWNGIESLPSNWKLTLTDLETGIATEMNEISEYVFNAHSDQSAKVSGSSILVGPSAKQMKAKNETSRFFITIVPQATTVSTEPGDQPEVFALEQNYPNPFNPSTTIKYSVDATGPVTLSVYNLMGQKVAELINETKSAGDYNVTWNASQLASGMYYYRLESAGRSLTRKMTLIK